MSLRMSSCVPTRLTRRIAAVATSVTAVAALTFAPAASANVSTSTPRPSGHQATVVTDDGPHAPANRVLAPTQTTRADGVIIKDVDLGNIVLGARGHFRAPVRGVVVALDRANAHAPLVLFAHQR